MDATTLADQLAQLSELRQAGHLTREEYELAQAKLLATPRTYPSGPPRAEESDSTKPVPSVSRVLGQVLGLVIAVAAVAWIVNGANGLPGVGGLSGCEAAFADAADGSIAGSDLYDLDPAMRACGSLAAWSAAWAKYPPPMAGGDPRFVAENRCLTGMFDSTAICRELKISR